MSGISILSNYNRAKNLKTIDTTKEDIVFIAGLDKAELLSAFYYGLNPILVEPGVDDTIELCRKFIENRVNKNECFLDYINIFREVNNLSGECWDCKYFQLSIASDVYWRVTCYNEGLEAERRGEYLVAQVRLRTIERITTEIDRLMLISHKAKNFPETKARVKALVEQLELITAISKLCKN